MLTDVPKQLCFFVQYGPGQHAIAYIPKDLHGLA